MNIQTSNHKNIIPIKIITNIILKNKIKIYNQITKININKNKHIKNLLLIYLIISFS
jgi:hypothetical protein